MRVVKFSSIVCILFLLLGCSQVKVSPTLSSSLSYNAYKNMKVIELRDESVGLVFDKNLLNVQSNQSIKMGDFSFHIGEAFAVKFIKALSHQFQTIVLLDNEQDMSADTDIDTIMRVSLQDIDSSMDLKQGFSKVSTETYTRLSVRAELKNIENKNVIWVGTSQVNHTSGIEEKMLTYQEAGRGFAYSFDQAIDISIGDLLNQMRKSQNLNNYFSDIDE